MYEVSLFRQRQRDLAYQKNLQSSPAIAVLQQGCLLALNPSTSRQTPQTNQSRLLNPSTSRQTPQTNQSTLLHLMHICQYNETRMPIQRAFNTLRSHDLAHRTPCSTALMSFKLLREDVCPKAYYMGSSLLKRWPAR